MLNRISPDARSFLTRALVAPFVVAVIAWLSVAAFAPDSTTVATASSRVMSTPEAEARVEQQLAAETDATSCWEDEDERAGRTPATAMVKDDGGVDVREVSADVAWDLSAAGKVWILAWCE